MRLILVGGLLVAGCQPATDAPACERCVDASDATPEDASDAQVCTAGVWTSQSTQLDIDMSFFPVGTSGWTATRSEMSPAMLAKLDQLCSLPPRKGPWSDPKTFRFRITDGTDGVRTYRAAVFDELGSEYGNDTPVLPYARIEGLVPSGCLFSGGDRFQDPDAGIFYTASDDPGCLHTLELHAACAPIRFKLKVSTAADYSFAIVDGPATTRIRVRTPDDSAELAASTTATAPAGAALTYHFAQPDLYSIVVEASDGQTCSTPSARFRLRIRH